MRTVNPTDGMKHCPVKLICNCVFKACLIMHLHKAAKLKSCWQLSSVTSVFSYCSFGRSWQGGVQISMCTNQLSKFTCVKKKFPSTWQDFILHVDCHWKVYYPYPFSVQARQNSHHVKHQKFLKGLMQRQGDDEGKSEQQQANHPVREELETYCVRGKALRGRQSTRKGSWSKLRRSR